MNFLLWSACSVCVKGSLPGVVFSFAVQDRDNARVLLAVPTETVAQTGWRRNGYEYYLNVMQVN